MPKGPARQPLPIGEIFGKQTLIAEAEDLLRPGKIPYRTRMALVRCICGKERIVRWATLKAGTSKSCGVAPCMQYTTTPLRERLMAKVVIPEDLDKCWGWTGSISADGYANISANGSWPHASRAAYQVLVGEIPKGLSVLHRCDNPLCCNPRHLYVGDQARNMRDMAERGRGLNGERNPNAKLTQADVEAIRKDPRLHREIAIDYNVVRQQITRIKGNLRWKKGTEE